MYIYIYCWQVSFRTYLRLIGFEIFYTDISRAVNPGKMRIIVGINFCQISLFPPRNMPIITFTGIQCKSFYTVHS